MIYMNGTGFLVLLMLFLELELSQMPEGMFSLISMDVCVCSYWEESTCLFYYCSHYWVT